jgi:hypothetical protein
VPQTTASPPASKRGRHVAGLGDPASREHRVIARQRRAHPVEQLERCDRSAHVPPRLDALLDHGIRAGLAREQALAGRAALMDPQLCRPSPRPSPEGDDHIGLRGCLKVGPPRERQQQIHRHRLCAERPELRDLPAQLAGREDPDRAESARLRDRGCELRSRQPPAHARLDDRQLYSGLLQKPGHAVRPSLHTGLPLTKPPPDG